MPKEDDALRKTGKQAIEHSFVETDKKYFDVVAGSKPLNMSLLSAGTTANIILLDQLTGHLISANVGDSQTVVREMSCFSLVTLDLLPLSVTGLSKREGN